VSLQATSKRDNELEPTFVKEWWNYQYVVFQQWLICHSLYKISPETSTEVLLLTMKTQAYTVNDTWGTKKITITSND